MCRNGAMENAIEIYVAVKWLSELPLSFAVLTKTIKFSLTQKLA